MTLLDLVQEKGIVKMINDDLDGMYREDHKDTFEATLCAIDNIHYTLMGGNQSYRQMDRMQVYITYYSDGNDSPYRPYHNQFHHDDKNEKLVCFSTKKSGKKCYEVNNGETTKCSRKYFTESLPVLNFMTVDRLKNECKTRKLTGYSRLCKDKLIDLLCSEESTVIR